MEKQITNHGITVALEKLSLASYNNGNCIKDVNEIFKLKILSAITVIFFKA